jgi:putative hemolysin
MTAVPWAVALVLLAATATLRMAGASLLRTHRADALHDAAEGVRGAARVAALLDEPRQVVPSVGLLSFALLSGAVAAGTWAVSTTWAGLPAAGALVALLAAVLVLGDVVPRGIGRRRPGRVAYRFSRLLALAVALGSAADDLVAEGEPDAPTESEDEEERVDEEERELISSVLEFSETVVREVMVPRADVVAIPVTATFDDVLDVVVETGFSRVPVVGEGLDDIVGVVFARDLLRLLDEGRSEAALTTFTREATFVPETKRVPDLLRFMQTEKVHLVVVVDEFGGTAGIATIEDLLEELVGEIADEFDDDEQFVVSQPDGSLLVDARLAVDELAELVSVDLPDEEWDTVGGLVLSLSGRVPRVGERFEVGGISLVPTRVQGRRISQVRVVRKEEG